MAAAAPVTGPVEWIAITFAGGGLDAGLVPPLAELVASGTVRVIDAAVVHTDAGGGVTVTELEDEPGPSFDAVDGEVLELLSDDDLRLVAEGGEPDSTTVVLVWENRWAGAFADAVRAAGGTVVTHDRVPRDRVEQALDAAAERP